MQTPMSEQQKMIEAARPSAERNVIVYQMIEELVKRQFGAHADASENIARAAAIMNAFALEQHAIYTQRVAIVLPTDALPPSGSNGSTGKPS